MICERTAGQHSGSIILKKTSILCAPSNLALSMISFGTPTKYSRIKKTVLTDPNNEGRINGHGVSVKYKVSYIKYEELIVMQEGIIIVNNRKGFRYLRPFLFYIKIAQCTFFC